jgi:hypothetical protein
VHLLLLCTVTNKCTIILQIVTLLHVSTLECQPQVVHNQYLAKLHKYFKCFSFMLPCIVINFFLNNKPDTLIIQIYCYKTLHVSGIISAHRQEFSTVHSALVSCRFFMTFSKQSQDVPFWLCLEAVNQNLHETYQCRMYSRELLTMGRGDARNM